MDELNIKGLIEAIADVPPSSPLPQMNWPKIEIHIQRKKKENILKSFAKDFIQNFKRHT